MVSCSGSLTRTDASAVGPTAAATAAAAAAAAEKSERNHLYDLAFVPMPAGVAGVNREANPHMHPEVGRVIGRVRA